MDITKTYTKMCKHKFIQSQWSPDVGDFFVATRDYEEVQGDDWPCIERKKGSINVLHNAYRIDDDRKAVEGVGIWLPRQDQIQEMLDDNKDFVLLNHRFQFFWERFVNDGRLPEGYQWNDGFKTPEQLWLAFYMDEKHQKHWDGKSWV